MNKPSQSGSKEKIAVIALILSVISFLWTFYNTLDENKRWKALNIGDVEISDAFFIMQKTLYKKDTIIKKMEYEPFLIKEIDKDKHLYTGKLLITYELIWYDIKKGQRLPQSNGFFTVEEGLKEIKRIKK